jgi:MarR family transcriptional regulator, organic hydroperoxide resistance regulator
MPSQGPLPWLKRAYFAGRKAFDEALAKHNLTASQLEVLRLVWQHELIEQRALQELLGIASPTLTGIVERLVERQMLRRLPSADDARVKLLALTEQGQALHGVLITIQDEVQARLLNGFSAAEVALLEQWLRRITANVEGSAADCD